MIQSYTMDSGGLFLIKPVHYLLPVILYSLDNFDVAHVISSTLRVALTYFSLSHASMMYMFWLLQAVTPM